MTVQSGMISIRSFMKYLILIIAVVFSFTVQASRTITCETAKTVSEAITSKVNKTNTDISDLKKALKLLGSCWAKPQ